MADLRLYNFAFLYVYTSLLSFTIYSTSMHKFISLQKSLTIEQVLGLKTKYLLSELILWGEI